MLGNLFQNDTQYTGELALDIRQSLIYASHMLDLFSELLIESYLNMQVSTEHNVYLRCRIDSKLQLGLLAIVNRETLHEQGGKA